MFDKWELVFKILISLPFLVAIIGCFAVSTDKLKFFREIWIYFVTAFYGVSILSLWLL